jgi:peptidoglycan hydrolase-like protein with peptidoglycan-binding domain
MNVHKMRRVAIAAATLAVAGLSALPASAEPPAANSDISGKTVYLMPNAALRYGKSLLSRVYTRTGGVLELKGTGPCTIFNCPVVHNNVQLFARRVRLDLAAPAGAGPVLSDRTLREGDDGEDVKALQQALNAKGFNVTVDGKFGASTTQAVIDFQRSANLATDGVVGPAVRAALTQSAASVKPVEKAKPLEKVKEAIKEKIEQIKRKGGKLVLSRTLRRGDEGDDVRQLQEFLNSKGYKVTVDGRYGAETQSAIRDFQGRVGLNPDGSVGPLTLEKLNA